MLLSVYMIVTNIILCPGGNSISVKVQPLRGTNYCFKCHTLTGERPSLHSSFIAALRQMLLSICEANTQSSLDPDAGSSCSFCFPAQWWWHDRYSVTVHRRVGFSVFLWWDNATDCTCRTLPWNLHKLTTGSITGVKVIHIKTKIHPLSKEGSKAVHDFPPNFGFFLSSCPYARLSLVCWQWPETDHNVSQLRTAKPRNMDFEISFVTSPEWYMLHYIIVYIKATD